MNNIKRGFGKPYKNNGESKTKVEEEFEENVIFGIAIPLIFILPIIFIILFIWKTS